MYIFIATGRGSEHTGGMNIKPLINDLRNLGVSQTDVAKELGCTQPLIAYYVRTGNDPKYELGKALIEFHAFEKMAARRAA